MLALRLTRVARPAVQLRRLLVALASAGTGFLLLCTLGHALDHPQATGASVLRLAWCAVPLAAMAKSPRPTMICAAAIQPRRRPSQARPGKSSRSSSGAQTNFSE